MTIKQVRGWIAVCDKAGIGVPDEVRVLDAYATLLEANLAHCQEQIDDLKKRLTAAQPIIKTALVMHRNHMSKIPACICSLCLAFDGLEDYGAALDGRVGRE